MVLARRIERIIRESAEKSFNILCLTRTSMSAGRIRRRIDVSTGRMHGHRDVSWRINVTTYGEFGAAMLRQHGHLLEVRSNFEILAQDVERRAVLDAAIAEAGSTYGGRRLLPLFSRLVERNVAADEAADLLAEWMPQDAPRVGDVYGRYRRLMIENGELDQVFVVAEAARLLADTAAGRLASIICPYACVDGSLGIGLAECRLLRGAVNSQTKNLFAVADPDGPGELWSRFGVQTLQLPDDRDCPPDVVEEASRLSADDTVHGTGSSSAVRVMDFETDGEEAGRIAGDIVGRPAGERGGCGVLS